MSKRKMKDSGVEWLGEIPAEWDVGRVKNDFCATKEIAGAKADSYQRLALTLSGVVMRSNEDAGGLQPEEFEGYQVLRKNELVFKLIDLQNVKTSRVGRSPFEIGIVSPAYIVLRHRHGADTRYAEYFFLSMWMHEVFNTMGDDAVRSCLNRTDLLNIPFLMPSENEQRKIAAYLDGRCAKIDEMISDAKKTIEEYKAWKSSVIFEAVTGKNTGAKMKDSGVDWIGMVPSGWEIVPLRRLGSCVNGISKGGEFFGSGYPFVSYSDVYKNDWLPASVKGLVESTPEERKHYSVREGDVFFTRTSETVDELGMAGACLKTIPDAVFAGFLIRFRPDTTELAVEYSKYYFRNVSLRNFFAKETMLVTRASLSQDLLRSMMVVVPPRSEQIAIARFLDKKCAAIDRVISEKESLISDLESYKKSLIFECVTGKMEVA